jgi:flagellar protein FlbD
LENLFSAHIGIISFAYQPIYIEDSTGGICGMIELTRLNGNAMVLNSDLIKTAEASPDTMLTLINGEKLIVREDLVEVVGRVLTYRSRLLADVAGRVTSSEELQQAASWVSLDVSGGRVGSLNSPSDASNESGID